MIFLRLLCSLALLIAAVQAEDALDLQAVKTTVETTKLSPSIETTSKSKTEKRDSSDQTASFLDKSKDEPFRPIYHSSIYEQSPPPFEPTTVRYVAAEAAPQAYYQKPETDGIHYASVSASSIGGGSANEQQRKQHGSAGSGSGGGSSISGGIKYAPTAIHRYNLNDYRQQHQQQQQLPTKAHRQQQQQQQHKQQPEQVYSYANEAETPSIVYDRATLSQYQPSAMLTSAAPHNAPQQAPQRIQYIIAIPLSYMRQLQQQLHGLPQATSSNVNAAPTTSTTSSTTTSTAAPTTPPHSPQHQHLQSVQQHPVLQLVGPLARDHHGMYRPYYQADAVPTSAYAQSPYLQLPSANLILLAPHTANPFNNIYAKPAISMPIYQTLFYPNMRHSLNAQPLTSTLLYHQSQQQQHQAPAPISSTTPPQHAAEAAAAPQTIYTYPLQQQQRLLRLAGLKQQQQQQPQQQQHIKYAAATSTALPPSTARVDIAQQQHQQQPQQQHTAPLVHYNPIYVQAPSSEQQLSAHQQLQTLQPHQYATALRYNSGNTLNLAHESMPIHVDRLSASNALVAPIHHQHHHHQQPQQQLQQPIHHYYQHPILQQQQQVQQLLQHAPLHSYLQPQQQQQQPHPQPHQQPQYSLASSSSSSNDEISVPQSIVSVPAPIPYFSHPGAVHYGTHLFHPTAASLGHLQQHAHSTPISLGSLTPTLTKAAPAGLGTTATSGLSSSHASQSQQSQ